VVPARGQSSGPTDSSSSERAPTTLNYTGTFTKVDGQAATKELGVAANSLDLVVHSTASGKNDSVTITATLAIQGTLFDDKHSSMNDICLRFEISAQDQPLATAHVSSVTIGWDPITIPVTDTTTEDHGCAQPSASPQSKTGSLELAIEGETVYTRAHGELDFDGSKFEFESSLVGNTPDTNFVQGTAVDRDVFEQVLAKSNCPFEEFDKGPAVMSEECRAVYDVRGNYDTTARKSFRNIDVLGNLETAVLLGALKTSDGRALMPSLSGLMPVITRLAFKADSPADDGTARSAMNRLINIAIAIDLRVAK